MASGVEMNCAGIMSLPSKESLSPFLWTFLNQSFKSVEDLATTPSLLARLQSELERDNEELRKVQRKVLDTTVRGVSYYHHLASTVGALSKKIDLVGASNKPLGPSSVGPGRDGDDLGSFDVEEEEGSWEDLESSEIERLMNPEAEERSEGFKLNRRVMVEELEALAGEVARVERMRLYAESVLKLERLVGDLEASVAVIAGSGRPSAQVGSSASSLRITRAVQRMQNAENAVAEIAGARWNCLVSAVDVRVDKVAAIVRPAAIADHRTLLASVGWPPPLLSAGSTGGDKLANPLLDMSEDQERKYCQSFMALAILQAVQQGRRDRQLKERESVLEEDEASPSASRVFGRSGRSRKRMKSTPSRAPLWAVEELITPVAAKAEPHFLKWTTKPELVFALAYRIAQEYVDVIDDFLQPLIDQAKLAGFSAREEWIFSLVSMVSRYLQAHVLPGLANDVRDHGGAGSVGAALWLHIVDQALSFDSRMKALAARALGLFQEGSNEDDQGDDGENLSGPVTLSISAIAARAEWLAIWARVELEEVLERLKAELQTDLAWDMRNKSSSSFLGLVEGGSQAAKGLLLKTGEFRAPAGADTVLSAMSAVMDRCRSLPDPDEQYRFVKDGVMPISRYYFQVLLRRCQEVEALTALAEQDSMAKVCVCVNAARYCEHSLRDWGEDIFFLELLQRRLEDSPEGVEEALDGSIFDEEIDNFGRFRQDWVGRLVSSISRGFEARCSEYVRNKKRWLEVGGRDSLEIEIADEQLDLSESDLLDRFRANVLKDFTVSPSLVDALVIMQNQLRVLQVALDNVNFSELWRNLAAALDQFLIQSIVFSGTKFSEQGGWQFAADVQALFVLFKPFSVRPSAFFKALHEAVKLLTLPIQHALSVLHFAYPERSADVVDSLKQYGVRKLPPSTALRILNTRIFPKL